MTQNICLLNDSFPPVIDGVANAVVNYATHLTKMGSGVVVMTPYYPGTEDSNYPFPVIRYPSIDTTKLVGYRAGAPFSTDVARYLKSNHVDLLHTHCPVASTFLARSIRNAADAPVVFTYHTKFDIDIKKALHGKLLQESTIHVLAQNISACDEVWVVSRGAGENLRSLGYQGDYIVMPNGVDLPLGRVDDTKIEIACAQYDLPHDVPVFLFVGRLMWYKGIRIILDALAALKSNGLPFRMVFIGDGTDRTAIESYSHELQLDNVCFFIGALHDRETLRAWYCRADLFLFPSTFDTNGLVVREAAACGLGSVLVRGSCAAEDAAENEDAFLISENAAAMASKLTELILRPRQMKRIGENAMSRLYISWEDAVAHAGERYQVVIDRYRSGAYRPHKQPIDDLFAQSGELMEVISTLEQREQQFRQETLHHLQSQRKGTEKHIHDAYDNFWDRYR